ncbi:MAG: glycosyltransferase family 2 protein [Patescibacteria group bacterium]|nr:glycosyltransferase family 2 protein [Patescibacteria group bacterium]
MITYFVYPIIDVIEWLLVFFTLYALIIPLGGLKKVGRRKETKPKSTFAIFIPAHNEEKVVGPLLDSCFNLDYPRELFDVYVIADNCDDGTVKLSLSKGANVIKRSNSELKGKGYALDYGFQEVFRRREYSAAVVVDADNLIKSDFLKIMNAELLKGKKILQGRMDVKNPNDTWVTAIYAMSVWVSNRFFYYAKNNLGFSAALGGTGMCISSDILEKIGWGATSLTEDWEFTIKALIHGVKTDWVHDAIVYDEKPLAFGQTWRQRLRWVRGQFVVAFRYFPELLWRGVSKADFVALESIVQLLMPVYLVTATLMSVVFLTSLRQYAFDPFLGKMLFSTYWEALWTVQYAVFSFVMPVAATLMDGGSKLTLKYILLFPIYQYSWIPLAWLALFTHRNVEWMHTAHTRAINLKQMDIGVGINVPIPEEELAEVEVGAD